MTKVLVSIEDELLKEVDRRARELQVSRSRYLANLVEHDVRERAREAIARAKALSRGYSGGPSAEVAVREMRDEL